MDIKEKKLGDQVICQISGEVDVTTSPDLRKLFERMARDKTKTLVLNLQNVSYIDSSGLATLVEGLQRAKSYNGKLKLTNLSGKAKSLFEITKLERIFDIYDSEEAALKQ
ncbi:MAG: STAS domain-containing protein [Candidatus Omnitrophota bacterium]